MSFEHIKCLQKLLDGKVKEKISGNAPSEKIAPLILYRLYACCETCGFFVLKPRPTMQKW